MRVVALVVVVASAPLGTSRKREGVLSDPDAEVAAGSVARRVSGEVRHVVQSGRQGLARVLGPEQSLHANVVREVRLDPRDGARGLAGGQVHLKGERAAPHAWPLHVPDKDGHRTGGVRTAHGAAGHEGDGVRARAELRRQPLTPHRHGLDMPPPVYVGRRPGDVDNGPLPRRRYLYADGARTVDPRCGGRDAGGSGRRPAAPGQTHPGQRPRQVVASWAAHRALGAHRVETVGRRAQAGTTDLPAGGGGHRGAALSPGGLCVRRGARGGGEAGRFRRRHQDQRLVNVGR